MRGHRITYKKNIKVVKMLQIERHPIKDIMKWAYVHNEIGSYLPTCEYNIRDWFWKVLNSIAFDKFKKLIKNA